MRITGGQVFDLEQGFIARDVCTDGALISQASGGGETLDASGCYVIPGLVDVHFHGCMGEDFSDATPQGLQRIADFELSQGVTYLCPAGMTLPEDQLTAICRNTAAHRRHNAGGAEVVGAHLEGPFLCMAKKGAQNGDFLHDPDVPMLERLQAAAEGCVKLVTVAPEQPGSLEFIKAAREMGIHVSVGHTVADYSTAKAAFEAGASHATHLYNGMPSLLHRAPGVIGAAFDAGASVELICDGLHIHPSVIRVTYQLFGDKLNLISDSLRCAGMPDGDYELGGQPIVVKNHKATLLDGTLAGSSISLLDAVRNVVSFGLPLAGAVYAASTAPALAVGLDAGVIAQGRAADLLVLDKDLALKAVFVDGKRYEGRP